MPKSRQKGVTDAAGFLFTPDAEIAPPADIAQPKPKPLKKAPDAAPHYHDHRERLRTRFRDAGPDALADYELLELILFRVIPRRDTKPTAKALINRFGDLASVLGAESARIAEVEGAGAAVALEIKAMQALYERILRTEIRKRPVVTSWSSLLAYIRLAMSNETREQFRVLFLDKKNQVIADEVQSAGTIDQAPVYPREVVRRALELGAAALILVHNHPSGDPAPSAADVAITREIVNAGKPLGVLVHDHVVVGRNGQASFKTLGLL